MINLSRVFVITSVLLLSYPVLSLAIEPNILINEIAWMGNKNSFNDEWIELYNPNDIAVDLSKWTLKSANEKIRIKLIGQIKPKSYFLLERTNDDSVLGIKADQIYTGSLNNNGEHLILLSNDTIIDEINHSNGWLFGDNKTKQTMEKNADIWQTSKNPEGTPKEKNSDGLPKVKQEKIVSSKTFSEKIDEEKNIDASLFKKQLSSFTENTDSANYFFIKALSLSFLIGIAIVFLKRRLKN
ncbi:MAG: lamin tail domain-containing protein [Patescibacteria group bacterium]